jgi:hypothetical protein
MHDRVQVGRTIFNTSARFRQPMDVVKATGIPIVEKLSILRAWEADERALQRAQDEGMGGGERPRVLKQRPVPNRTIALRKPAHSVGRSGGKVEARTRCELIVHKETSHEVGDA